MENAPVISISGMSPYPGVEPELWDRFLKWFMEVYGPLMMRWPARKGIDFYLSASKSPLMPFLFIINHHEDVTTQQNATKMPEMVSIYADIANWQKRNVTDLVVAAGYQLIKSFRTGISLPGDNQDTRIENAPLMHVEGCDLSTESEKKYNKWFVEYGIGIFIPLLMKQPGIKGYDYYRFNGFQMRPFNTRGMGCPAYLSMIYFEDSQAFDSFERSPELATFNKTMRSVFPLGLNYKWYTQYERKLSLRR